MSMVPVACGSLTACRCSGGMYGRVPPSGDLVFRPPAATCSRRTRPRPTSGRGRVLRLQVAAGGRNTKSPLGGTLPYMPPEHLQAVKDPQATGTMDIRGDVYSLGVILYELLTGTHPFGRFPKSRSVRTVAAEMLTRQRAGIRPVRESNPDV